MGPYPSGKKERKKKVKNNSMTLKSQTCNAQKHDAFL